MTADIIAKIIGYDALMRKFDMFPSRVRAMPRPSEHEPDADEETEQEQIREHEFITEWEVPLACTEITARGAE